MKKRLEIFRRTLLKNHPSSKLTQVPAKEIARFKKAYPGLPSYYWKFLQIVGHGSIGNSRYMIYECPLEPENFFDEETCEHFKNVLFIGDDLAGYHASFVNKKGKWFFKNIDHCGDDATIKKSYTFIDFLESWYGKNDDKDR